jgi:hypothetical protein
VSEGGGEMGKRLFEISVSDGEVSEGGGEVIDGLVERRA